jgi:CrcB protein
VNWQAVVSVGIGGAFGSILRYAVTVLAARWFGAGLPWGTLTVNLVGSFAIGVIFQFANTGALGISPQVRIFVAVGILGGFTTFSSFTLDTLNLTRDGTTLVALGYVLASVVLGLAAVYLGTVTARLVSPQ